jgi:hypothetical protein
VKKNVQISHNQENVQASSGLYKSENIVGERKKKEKPQAGGTKVAAS